MRVGRLDELPDSKGLGLGLKPEAAAGPVLGLLGVGRWGEWGGGGWSMVMGWVGEERETLLTADADPAIVDNGVGVGAGVAVVVNSAIAASVVVVVGFCCSCDCG